MTESDKLCNICFTKDRMKDYNCKTCKNIICDICFSKIVLKNKTFNDDYLNNQLMYNCPFCKGENKMSINVNHSISNNIIKGLINHIKKLPSTPAMMDSFVDHFLYNQNIQYINENRTLKLKIKELENNVNGLKSMVDELKLDLDEQYNINKELRHNFASLEKEFNMTIKKLEFEHEHYKELTSNQNIDKKIVKKYSHNKQYKDKLN